MTTQKHVYLSVAVFALLAVSLAVAVGDDVQMEHEGSACIPNTTDCDDMLPVYTDDDRCHVLSCEGGATDFTYCQIASSGGPCQNSSGESQVNCGTDCVKWYCGEPEPCDYTECDLSDDGTQYEGEDDITLGATC